MQAPRPCINQAQGLSNAMPHTAQLTRVSRAARAGHGLGGAQAMQAPYASPYAGAAMQDPGPVECYAGPLNQAPYAAPYGGRKGPYGGHKGCFMQAPSTGP